MREYNRVAGRFWTGPTGRAIRGKGRDAQVLALYLFTSPHMNMIGLYYLPIPTITYETGLDAPEIRAALAALADVGFAQYDEREELVWIPQAAVYQVGDEIKGNDNRAKGIKALIQPYKRHRFVRQFLDRYRRAYSLRINDERNDLARETPRPSKQGDGKGNGDGNGDGTDPPPQTPPPSGTEGPARENAEADPWALPPGLAPEGPSPNSDVPTVGGAPLRRALERLIAGEAAAGREVGDAMRKKLRKRLAGGALEHDLAAQLRQAAEKRTTVDRQERGWDEALKWIQRTGGRNDYSSSERAVVDQALSWLADNYTHTGDRMGQQLQHALEQWAQQAHAPPNVTSVILPDVCRAYERPKARGG